MGYVLSDHAVSETFSDSSARNVFFFSNNITGGLYTFIHAISETLSDSSASKVPKKHFNLDGNGTT